MRTTAVAASILVTICATVHAQQAQPPRRVVVDIDYDPAPKRIQDLVSSAAAILHGRVLDSEVRAAIPGRPDQGGVVSVHRVAVLETLKSSGALDAVVTVAQSGGTIDHRGTIFTTYPDGVTLLERGDEVLLFLSASAIPGEFAIVHGPAGMFLLNGPAVQLPETVRHFAREMGGRTTVLKADLLDRVRALARVDVAKGDR